MQPQQLASGYLETLSRLADQVRGNRGVPEFVAAEYEANLYRGTVPAEAGTQ